MNEHTLSPSSPSSPSAGHLDDSVDPELASLPEPPRAERRATFLLLALTALASLAMVLTLRRDAAYAFAPNDIAELGELRTAPAAALLPNSFVRGEGMLGGGGAIRFERSLESDSFRVAPVAGRPDVWVELRVPSGIEPGRYVPPTSFAGRLVRFDAAGPRHRGLAASVTELTGQPVPPGAWLLVDGEAPSQSRWAVALVVLFAGFAAWNAFVIARLARRVG
ncbi:MAG: hypothetical protein ACLQBL_36575 [Polyangiaceae bacterium]